MKGVKIKRPLNDGSTTRGIVSKKNWKKILKQQALTPHKTASDVFWIEFDLFISGGCTLRLAYPGSKWTEDVDPMDILKEIL